MGVIQVGWSLVVGGVAGLVASRLVADGTWIALLSRIALGILGALLGAILGSAIGRPRPGDRVQWTSLSLAVAGAALLLALWHQLPGATVRVAAPQRTPPVAVVERSSLLPAGAEPEAVVVLQKDAEGAMAPVLLGQLHAVPAGADGQETEKLDPLRPGNILIIRDLDEQLTKDLKISNGSAQVGGAYIARANHELEYLGQVDLSKRNKRLALEFGIKPPPATPTPTAVE
ncbi:MAG: GlsB/YeaQ/YmgE family stress response membrane protein [Candidatus Binatia bacterium]